MARKKVQKNLNVPPEIGVWFDAVEVATGATRGRIGIASALAFMMQSEHAQRLCLAAATAIDLGHLSLDEVLFFLRVVDPVRIVAVGPMAIYALEGAFAPHELVERIAIERSASESGEKPYATVESRKKETMEYERRKAECRWRDAEARLKAAGKLPKDSDGPKKPRKKNSRASRIALDDGGESR